MVSISDNVTGNGKISFLLIADDCSMEKIYLSFFIHSFFKLVNVWAVSMSVIVDCVAKNTVLHAALYADFTIFEYIPRVR